MVGLAALYLRFSDSHWSKKKEKFCSFYCFFTVFCSNDEFFANFRENLWVVGFWQLCSVGVSADDSTIVPMFPCVVGVPAVAFVTAVAGIPDVADVSAAAGFPAVI